MNTKKAILLGCGTVTFLGLLAVVGVVMFISHVAKDVEGVGVTINSPTDVSVGETFKLDVTVRNERQGKVLELSDIDIADEYFNAFTVVSVTPTPKTEMHVPIDNSQSFTFDRKIQPGKTQVFTWELRAEKPGIFRGDVDVCEGMQFVTKMAQTVVKEK
jgi:hypothetical protein